MLLASSPLDVPGSVPDPALPAGDSTTNGTQQQQTTPATPNGKTARSEMPPPRQRVSHLVGLLNQGATCYLNSLLQSLFMTRDFRALVFAWRPPPAPEQGGATKDDPVAAAAADQLAAERASRLQRSVPYQLQLLFARLALSRQRGAVSTEALTHSFGWSNAELFRQHDVQELMRVLFTALERTWAPVAPVPSSGHQADSNGAAAAAAASNPLADLYTGRLKDVIECRACHSRRSHTDTFQDLSLSVLGASSLEQAIGAFTKPEAMDGADQLRCDSQQCQGRKQDATKGLTLEALPRILTFQLKRFTFDFQLMQRTKVNGAFDFPRTLDMAPFMHRHTEANATTEASVQSSLRYELFAILMHSGVAVGGHYFAYLQSLTDGQWYEFNDAQVLELPGGLEMAMKNARGNDNHLKGGSSAYMILYRRVDDEPAAAAAAASPASFSSAGVSDLISPEVRACILEEERKYEADAAMAERERRTLEITVHYDTRPWVKLQRDMTQVKVCELTAELLQLFKLDGSDGQPPHQLADVRLRKYDPALKWASTIYAGDAEHTLEEALWPKQPVLLLEVKRPADQWAAYAADTVPLRCVFVTPKNVARLVEHSLHPTVTDEDVVCRVEVSKSQHTLVDLKKAILAGTSHSVPSVANQRISLLHENHCELLKDDVAPLHAYDLYPGRFLYVEHALDEVPDRLRKTFDQMKCQIEVCFNVPTEEGVVGAATATTTATMKPIQPEYTQKLLVSRNDTLGSVKDRIGLALGLPCDAFRVARSHTAQQFKDDQETLAELQLVDQSGIYVSHGRPLKKDEFQCTFYLYAPPEDQEAEATAMNAAAATNDTEAADTHPSSSPTLSAASSTTSTASSVASAASSSSSSMPPAVPSAVPSASSTTPSVGLRFQYLFDLPIRGDMLVSALKLHLLDCLAKKRPHPTVPGANGWAIRHLRLRDKKAAASTRVYEDGKTVQENAPGGKVEDGLEIVLQKLDAPEVWTKDQLMLQSQQWMPLVGRLGPVQDLVTRKNISVGGMKNQLYKMVHGRAFVAPPSASTGGEHTTGVVAGSSAADASAVGELAAPTDAAGASSLPLTHGELVSSPPTLVPTAAVVYPSILLAKGKLTGRMKKADMAKLAWARDPTADTKLLRNALALRAGELMMWCEELSPEEKATMAEAKEKKAKAAAEATAAAAAAAMAVIGDSADSTAPAKPTATAAAAARKPWQRGVVTGASRARKLGGSSSSSANAVVSSRPAMREHAVHIGFSEEEEKWLAAEAALEAARVQSAAAAAAAEEAKKAAADADRA